MSKRLCSGGLERNASLVILGLILVVQFLLVYQFRFEGLSLDEAGGWWTSLGSFEEISRKAVAIQGQSPLPYLLQGMTIKLFGDSEAVLRLPSHIALCLTTIGVYLLGRSFLAPFAALVGAAALGLHREYLSIAFVARPYSLAILTSLIALALVLRALQRESLWLAIGTGLVLSLLVYQHFIFMPFACSLVGSLILARRADGFSCRFAVIALAVGAVLIFPYSDQYLSLLNRRSELSFVPIDLRQRIIIITFICAISTAVFAMPLVVTHQQSPFYATYKRVCVILLAAVFLQPLALITFELVTGSGLFLSRYYSTSFIPAALLFAFFLANISPRLLRHAIGCIGALYSMSCGGFSPPGEGFKEVAKVIQEYQLDLPVWVSSGFIESKNIEYMGPGLYGGFFRSPFQYYLSSRELTAIPGFIDSIEKITFVRDRIRTLRLRSSGYWVALRSNLPITDTNTLMALSYEQGCWSETEESIRELTLMRFRCGGSAGAVQDVR